ncbi:DUF177 domain-containing protein [Ferrovibrio sp.]|uniref:YceD family protein n=1 Tax=Ferrovibrio sp. TaxID=1917215 RepID=UPI0025C1734F|nr:DUF177 domain-containing protein [Ferrovibrio sp.]MBX3454024.1 DUF177 domain-containing protein [Ferrovibrio sp.]
MPKAPVQSEFSHVVEVVQIGPAGVNARLKASPAECAALAQRLRIPAVFSLEAEVRLEPAPENGQFRLIGTLVADVEQTCVVSLEPVKEHVETRFERIYAPPETIEPLQASVDDEEPDWLDPDAVDPPDPIEDGRIDMGEAVAEELALSLDPYPRKPDADFPAGYRPEPEDEAVVSPFAALAKLKKGPG